MNVETSGNVVLFLMITSQGFTSFHPVVLQSVPSGLKFRH